MTRRTILASQPANLKQQKEEPQAPSAKPSRPVGGRVPALRRLRWVLVPLLAITAYATVLRIGFLSDDWLLLTRGISNGLNPNALLPDPTWFFYRPFGTLVTWGLGATLWGINPLPYHLLGLLLHAGTALLFGLAVAEMTRRQTIGLLAGCLFAVFPANLEAVGWLAAQWDLWAAFFGLWSLLLFCRWWKRPTMVLYIEAVITWTLGIFSKESLITFLPVFVLAAWLMTPRPNRAAIKRVILALLPLAVALVINLSIRIATWGNIGGYQGAGFQPDVTWDRLLVFTHVLLAPISATSIGQPVVQVVGLLTGTLLLLGLIWHGRAQWRLLLVAAAWVLLTLSPVLSLSMNPNDLGGNRFLYLSVGGWCFGLATLLTAAIAAVRRYRDALAGATVVVLLLAVVATWAHLRPWHTASVIVDDAYAEIRRFIPPQPAHINHIWYVEKAPDTYKGVYLFRLGLGNMRLLKDGDGVFVQSIAHAVDAPLFTDKDDSFALRFAYDDKGPRYHIDYAAGITSVEKAPTGADSGANLQLWDFSSCDAQQLAAWQVAEASAECKPGEGLVLTATTDDVQMQNSNLALSVSAEAARFVRLRVGVTYDTLNLSPPPVYEWFWQDTAQPFFGGDKRMGQLLRQAGGFHVYWTYLPVAGVSDTLRGLRFDPINAKQNATLRWIAVDLVQ